MNKPTERGILFKDSMAQSILDDLKTETRRIVKPQPKFTPLPFEEFLQPKQSFMDTCPYGKVGDILFVRETHFALGIWAKNGKTKTGAIKYKFVPTGEKVRYMDNPPEKYLISRHAKYPEAPRWYKRNSLFMLKSDSRIWLEIKDIRVEPLQDISAQDAINEGIERTKFSNADVTIYKDYLSETNGYENPIDSLRSLFISINGFESWNNNPYIWVIKFRLLSKTGKQDIVKQ